MRLLISFGRLLERGANLDLEVLDLVHYLLALLGDSVGSFGLKVGHLSGGFGNCLVYKCANGGLARLHISNSVVRKGAEGGKESIGFVLHIVYELITVVAEPVNSLLTLLFDAVKDLLEDSFDLSISDPLFLLEVGLIWIIYFQLGL